MKLYQIDYKRLALLLLPTFLRKPRIFAFLSAFVFGVSVLHNRFMKNRTANLLRIKRNGQVCYLKGMLNDELDPDKMRIRITDQDVEGDWVFAMDEEEPYQLFIDNKGITVYGEGLIITNTAFFYVSVPWKKEDTNMNDRMKSFLNEYKLLSKKYIISYE